MADSFLVTLAVGIPLGFMAGLGTGGGSLLILWLTFVLHMDPGIARSINLMFFIPSALIACFFRWRQGALQWHVILPGILWGCIAAAAMSWLESRIETDMLRKLFGVLLIGIGLKELFYRERKAR